MKLAVNLIASVVLVVCLPFIVLGVVVFGLWAIWGKGKKAGAGEQQTVPVGDTAKGMFGVN